VVFIREGKKGQALALFHKEKAGLPLICSGRRRKFGGVEKNKKKEGWKLPGLNKGKIKKKRKEKDSVYGQKKTPPPKKKKTTPHNTPPSIGRGVQESWRPPEKKRGVWAMAGDKEKRKSNGRS